MTEVEVKKLERLIRISEAVHAGSNKLDEHADWYLDEAKCDCEQCENRRK